MEQVYVSLESLERLQSELREMADELYQIYKKSDESLDRANVQWKDVQFSKFDDEFKYTREKIIEASAEMNYLADVLMQKRIDAVSKIQQLKL